MHRVTYHPLTPEDVVEVAAALDDERVCVFRRIPATDSEVIRPPIPTLSGH
jgi:hypothetical protein